MFIELAITASVMYSIGYYTHGYVAKHNEKIKAESASAEIENRNKKKEQDVSEPVTSFVNTFLANPKRFKHVREVEQGDGKKLSKRMDTIIDKKNGLEFTTLIEYGSYYICDSRKGLGNVKFLTHDEIGYIHKVLGDYYINRKKKYAEIMSKRGRRVLTRIYQEG